jgi:hypothetical protein
VKAPALLAAGVIAAVSALALVHGPLASAADDKVTAGKQAFAEVARVLQSPRCRNCHPTGDRPLQGDPGKPHAMNISRASVAAGLPCTTCHQERNADAIGIPGGPPGAPHWSMPTADHPMVFQGKAVTALCEQLKDPAQNGQRTLTQLLDHVSHDPLVLWGWSPGGTRPVPPLSHDQFVAAFAAWVASNGACP